MSSFTVPKTILVGDNALEEAVAYFSQLGKKALVVTGKHVGASVMIQYLKNALERSGVSYAIFDGITGEPTDEMIKDGLKVYREHKCDFCIGIGGGSPLDAAKAIAAMDVNAGSISDYNGKEIPVPAPPIVAVPTTAGTGSEATKFTIITDSKREIKMLLKGESLLPQLAIVDYRMSMSAPASVTAATGLDALTHAVEAYTSKKASPMTDTLAVSAVKRILKWLPVAYTDGTNTLARKELAIAALEAGICIHNSSVTIVHGMSRPIGALFHVSHGLSNAMLLTTCIRNVADGDLPCFARLARETGVASMDETDEQSVGRLMDALEAVCRSCEVPSLQAYGIEREVFLGLIDKMAEDAMASGSPGNCRKTVTKEDCVSLYREIIDLT